MGLANGETVDRLTEAAALIRAWFDQSQSSWREFGPLPREPASGAPANRELAAAT